MGEERLLGQPSLGAAIGWRTSRTSTRTGFLGVWVSDADGSNPVQPFLEAGKLSGSPSWSPDGQRLPLIPT